MNIYFILKLLACAFGQGFFKAVSDGLMSGAFQSAFNIKKATSFFGIESWKRKYKNNDKANGLAYLFSDTLLVWTTDGWHLSNTLGMICNVFCLGIALSPIFGFYYALLVSMIYWIVRSGTFHLLFTYCYLIISKIRLKTNKNNGQ